MTAARATLLLAIVALTGCGSVVWNLGPRASAPARGDGLYIYRTSRLTAGMALIHVSAGHKVRQLYNGSYAFLPLAPGRHRVTVLLGRTRVVTSGAKVVTPVSPGQQPIPSHLIATAPTAEMRMHYAHANASMAQAQLMVTTATVAASIGAACSHMGDPYPAEVWSVATLTGGSIESPFETVVDVEVPANGPAYLRVEAAGVSSIGAAQVAESEGAGAVASLSLSPGGLRE